MLKTLKFWTYTIAVAVMVVLIVTRIAPVQSGWHYFINGGLNYPGRLGPLNEEELRWAKVAWRYFQNNTQPVTGLVNAQDNYPTTSLWQIGDTLVALTAARQLGLVKPQEFDQRLSKILATLSNLPLTPPGVPNLLYDAAKGTPITPDHQPYPTGWAVRDISRLMLGLRMVASYSPEYASFIDRIILRWNFCPIVTPDGQLQNARAEQKQWRKQVESDVGFGSYSASVFELWGFQPAPIEEAPFKNAIINRIPIAFSAEDPRVSGVPVVVESTPYLLDGLEFSWKLPAPTGATVSLQYQRAQAIYQVQESRWQRDKLLTARADFARTEAPWLVHGSIFANGYPWNTLADDGTYRPDLALLSTRAIFGLWVLWDTPFTDALMQLGRWHNDEQRGWFEGRYENGGGHNRAFSLTTNAMVLESLFYKSNYGALIRKSPETGYLDAQMKDVFNRPNHCLPQERARLLNVEGK